MSDKANVIQCEHCGQRMRLPSEAKAKAYKCVKCGAPIRLGPPPEAPPPESAPAGEAKAAGEQGANAAAAQAGGEPPEPTAQARIGEMLVEQKLVTKEQVDEALALQAQHGGKTVQILLSLGHLDKEALHEFLSKQPGVAAIDLARFKVGSELLELVPKEKALENLIIPIDRLGKLLTIAMACPLDTQTIQELEATSGLRVKAMLAKFDDIRAAVDKYYRDESDDQGTDFYSLFPTLKKQMEEGKGKGKGKSGEIPQETALRIHEMAFDGNIKLPAFVSAIEAEAGLRDHLIGLANGPAYGIPGKVNDAATAVALLGREGVAQVVAGVHPDLAV